MTTETPTLTAATLRERGDELRERLRACEAEIAALDQRRRTAAVLAATGDDPALRNESVDELQVIDEDERRLGSKRRNLEAALQVLDDQWATVAAAEGRQALQRSRERAKAVGDELVAHARRVDEAAKALFDEIAAFEQLAPRFASCRVYADQETQREWVATAGNAVQHGFRGQIVNALATANLGRFMPAAIPTLGAGDDRSLASWARQATRLPAVVERELAGAGR